MGFSIRSAIILPTWPIKLLCRAVLRYRLLPRPLSQPSPISGFAAVKACGSAGQWEKALWLLAQVRDRRLHPDTVTLNAVMDALGRYSRL